MRLPAAPGLRGAWLAALLGLAGCSAMPEVGTAPIADRPIDLVAHCAQTEEDGFHEDATLAVRDGRVDALSWRIRVGSRGSCSFDQRDFRQTRRHPHVELLARDGSGCRLMVWQQPGRVTLAHAGCARSCTAGIYEQAMPVMFDPASGGCARP